MNVLFKSFLPLWFFFCRVQNLIQIFQINIPFIMFSLLLFDRCSPSLPPITYHVAPPHHFSPTFAETSHSKKWPRSKFEPATLSVKDVVLTEPLGQTANLLSWSNESFAILYKSRNRFEMSKSSCALIEVANLNHRDFPYLNFERS